MDGIELEKIALRNQTRYSRLSLYMTFLFSLGTICILLGIVGFLFIHRTFREQNKPAGVIPVLIHNKQDLNDALKAYDNTRIQDSAVQSGLNQNNQAISQFSQ